jgi:NarL family two-component system response regulator LiaR
MLQAQASGYLLKNTSAEDMERAIHSVHAGETVFSPVIAKALAAKKTVGGDLNPGLSTQQHKVLCLLVQGFNNTEIAIKLNISQPTARYHVSAILLKLGVATRVEAAALAIKRGLLGTPSC